MSSLYGLAPSTTMSRNCGTPCKMDGSSFPPLRACHRCSCRSHTLARKFAILQSASVTAVSTAVQSERLVNGHTLCAVQFLAQLALTSRLLAESDMGRHNPARFRRFRHDDPGGTECS